MDSIAAKQKAYDIAHREEIRAWKKAYYEAHKAEIKARTKAYREAHKAERRAYIKTYGKVYYETHKEEAYEYNRTRRARKINAQGKHTAQDVQAQYTRQKGECYYAACGHSKLGKVYHVDHIIPLSRGGSNGPENLVIACPTCNLSKHNKLLHEWVEGGRLL